MLRTTLVEVFPAEGARTVCQARPTALGADRDAVDRHWPESDAAAPCTSIAETVRSSRLQLSLALESGASTVACGSTVSTVVNWSELTSLESLAIKGNGTATHLPGESTGLCGGRAMHGSAFTDHRCLPLGAQG